eukprot:CAMPEP_0119045816 /NCGR_PEP_ID=MMETSP1177-20130426/42752_1 /TAXON_ID=2985 /ORGANISM="Ochromonas sp, Strain CCMP1899" /LENGTH=170 /DNA_ID=CAMNT_0007018189 /DNA_START=189 /DNA_END=698 /DNA_ORIENTATION=-
MCLSGMVAWGYMNWGNLLIEERSILTLKLYRRNIQPESIEGEERSIAEECSLENEDYLGIYTISGKQIMNTYRERDDTVAVAGNLLSVTYEVIGRISVVIKVTFPPVLDTPIDTPRTGTLGDHSVREGVPFKENQVQDDYNRDYEGQDENDDDYDDYSDDDNGYEMNDDE